MTSIEILKNLVILTSALIFDILVITITFYNLYKINKRPF